MIELPQNPIFIVGFPRSGTTLLQSLLCAQEGIYSFPETHFFRFVRRALTDDPGSSARVTVNGLQTGLDALYTYARIDLPAVTTAALNALAAQGRLTSQTVFEQIVQYCLGEHVGRSGYRWLEKTPNHVYYLDRILDWYPAAQFVHIVRNPVPAIQSRRKKFEDRQVDPVSELAREWMRAIHAFEQFRDRHPAAIYSVRYEDLAGNTAGVLAGIAAFLGFELDPTRLDSYQTAGQSIIQPWETWKQDVITRPIANTNTQYRVPHTHLIRIDSIAGDTMRAYGYDVPVNGWIKRLYTRTAWVLKLGAETRIMGRPLPGHTRLDHLRNRLLLEVD
ncbi:MAG: sulfotransferase [Anaerolineae bacterium]|nr:sulfotransferase [Anaerolineae bacterium]